MFFFFFFAESETKKMDDSKGMITDIKNNNTLEEEEQKLNNQNCIQCSTASSQRSTNSSNTNSYTTSITGSTSSSSSCNNFQNVLDHHITAMIDDSQSTVINTDLIGIKKNGTINANNDQKFSSFLTVADHSIRAPTKSQKCLSPVVEDSNSSGSSFILVQY